MLSFLEMVWFAVGAGFLSLLYLLNFPRVGGREADPNIKVGCIPTKLSE